MEALNMFFMILAFVGMYTCGFISCLLIVFGMILHQQNKELKRKKA